MSDTKTRQQPIGLDQQGRYPVRGCDVTNDDDTHTLGKGAFLPAFLALALVCASAALVLVLL